GLANMDLAILTAGHQPPAVTAEGNRMHRLAVTFGTGFSLACRRIPELNLTIDTARGDRPTVRRPGQCQHLRPVAVQCLENHAAPHIPEPDGVIEARGCEAGPVLAKCDAEDRRRVAAELSDRLSRCGAIQGKKQQRGDLYLPEQAREGERCHLKS